jgi:outer membrane protein OmpA-like peptidoglycan-associated protein
MKRFIVFVLLAVVFGFQNHVQAQFRGSKIAWGLSGGGALGDNGGDKWVMQYRGYLQYDLIYPLLVGQLGVGYTRLEAPGVYSAQTGTADLRLLLSPFSLTDLYPYLYGGFGVSKALQSSATDYLPMVPFGAGVQTRISSGVLLDINGGYYLSLSDKLDGRVRTDTDLNSVTNQKQDGFYAFSIGVAFTIGSGYESAEELKKKELAAAEARRVQEQADAEARRVRELADVEARRVKQQADADAEARRVKQASDAEARRVKDLADAEAQRMKQATDAEARRVKDLADAEARRLAGQKPPETIIVLEKGKKVVLTGVTFEFNKATLTYASERILTIAYNALVANPDVSVEISGHTDNVGSQQYNQSLSLQRAQSVKNWLVNKGISSSRMKTVGKGMNEPVAPNTTDSGRAENRRIEFYVQQ